MNSILNFFSALTMQKKILLLLITPILTILLSVKGILLGLAVIIFFDLITGLIKSMLDKKRNNPDFRCSPRYIDFWRTLSSKGMRATWKKMYEYGVGIIVIAVLETMILGGESINFMNRKFGLTELAISIAAVVEVYSVYENIEAVTNGNIFKKMINMLPKGFRNLFGGSK